MTDEKRPPEIFRGHFEECLKHLGARFLEAFPKGSKKAAKTRMPMAEFCGVGVDTTTRWIYSDGRPMGGKYIKLVCFLEINGYRVIEWERTSQKRRNFARLIGFGLITIEQATEMLGYAEPSSLYRLLLDDQGASEKVDQKMWDMWKIRKDKLDEIVEKKTVKYRLNLSTSPQQTVPELQGESLAPKTNNCPRDGVVDIMQGLLKLLDSGVLHDLTDADWAAMRNSSSTVLRLSSHLSSLSARLVNPS